MSDSKPMELCRAELGRVVGGVLPNGTSCILNSRGQTVGYKDADGTIRYLPCKKCGKPLHEGTLSYWYCDPCNDYWSDPGEKVWLGSEEELKAKSL